MRQCAECGLEFPDEYMNIFWLGTTGYWTCPICALEFRNKIRGEGENEPFSAGSYAQWQYDNAVEFLLKGDQNECTDTE